MAVDTGELEQWFSQNLLLLILIGATLVVLYAYSSRFVHSIVRRSLKATELDFSGSGVEDAELEKRATTIESLATTLLRVTILGIGGFIVIGLLGAWSMLVLIGLFLAGLTIAGQAIVLDYLMGVLIILEGEFFQGDNIEIGNVPWAGTVESVGLRRTVMRGADGTVYSISNGELRLVANRTRIYAAAEVRIRGVRQGDVQRVMAVMAQVGREVAADPAFAAAIIEAPQPAFVDDPDELGSAVVMRGRVVASERWRVASEIRMRLDEALMAAGIELGRWSAPPAAGDA